MNESELKMMSKIYEEFQKLEGSEEYTALVSRKKELDSCIYTLTKEIFDQRNDDDKVEKLSSIKLTMEQSLKNVNDEICHMKESLTKALELKFHTEMLSSESTESSD